ncbi:hypothetical protein QOT17_012847 [Balamuthia mandrillaris]
MESRALLLLFRSFVALDLLGQAWGVADFDFKPYFNITVEVGGNGGSKGTFFDRISATSEQNSIWTCEIVPYPTITAGFGRCMSTRPAVSFDELSFRVIVTSDVLLMPSQSWSSGGRQVDSRKWDAEQLASNPYCKLSNWNKSIVECVPANQEPVPKNMVLNFWSGNDTAMSPKLHFGVSSPSIRQPITITTNCTTPYVYSNDPTPTAILLGKIDMLKLMQFSKAKLSLLFCIQVKMLMTCSM